MRRRRFVVTLAVPALLVLGAAGWSMLGSTEPSPKILTGELWQTMSRDARVAFVWGVGNLVEFERAQTGARPAGGKSFIPFLVEGLGGKPIDEVVDRVDAYYAARPGELKRPVIDAIFQAVVLPALKAEKEGGKTQ